MESTRTACSLEAAAGTDIGLKRGNNEDAYFILPEAGVFCVADGMGGAARGEVASQAAVEAVARRMSAMPGIAAASLTEKAGAVDAALNEASLWIHRYAAEHGYKSMGTTVVVLVFDTAGCAPAVALHAGDSRVYRFRDGRLSQLSRDHSLVEAAGLRDDRQLAPALRNVITRSVGIHESVKLERTPIDVQPGDLFLLCSDGLSRMLPDDAIQGLCLQHGNGDLTDLMDILIEEANAAGGRDNVTVVLVRVVHGRAPAPGVRENRTPARDDTAPSDGPITVDLSPTAPETTADAAVPPPDPVASTATATPVPDPAGAPTREPSRPAPATTVSRVPPTVPTGDDEPIRRGLPGWGWALLAAVSVAALAGGAWYARRTPSADPPADGPAADDPWGDPAARGDAMGERIAIAEARATFERRLREALQSGAWGELKRHVEAWTGRMDRFLRNVSGPAPDWAAEWRAARTPDDQARVFIGDAVRSACYGAWVREWTSVESGRLDPAASTGARRQLMAHAAPEARLAPPESAGPPASVAADAAGRHCRLAAADRAALDAAAREYAGQTRERYAYLWLSPQLLSGPHRAGWVGPGDPSDALRTAVEQLRGCVDGLDKVLSASSEWPHPLPATGNDAMVGALAALRATDERLAGELGRAVALLRIDVAAWRGWNDPELDRLIARGDVACSVLRADAAGAAQGDARRAAVRQALECADAVARRVAERMRTPALADAAMALDLGLGEWRDPALGIVAREENALFGAAGYGGATNRSVAVVKAMAAFLQRCPATNAIASRIDALRQPVIENAEGFLRAWLAMPSPSLDRAADLLAALPFLQPRWQKVERALRLASASPGWSSLTPADVRPAPGSVTWPTPRTAQHPWAAYASALGGLAADVRRREPEGQPVPPASAEEYTASWARWFAPAQAGLALAAGDGARPRWPACTATIDGEERLVVDGAGVVSNGVVVQLSRPWGGVCVYEAVNRAGRHEQRTLRLTPPDGVGSLVALPSWPWRGARAARDAWIPFLAEDLLTALDAAMRQQAASDLASLVEQGLDPRGLGTATDLAPQWSGLGSRGSVADVLEAFAGLGAADPAARPAAGSMARALSDRCSRLRVRVREVWQVCSTLGEPTRSRLQAVAWSRCDARVGEHLAMLLDAFPRVPAAERAPMVWDGIDLARELESLSGLVSVRGVQSRTGAELRRLADDAFYSPELMTQPSLEPFLRGLPWLSEPLRIARVRWFERNRR